MAVDDAAMAVTRSRECSLVGVQPHARGNKGVNTLLLISDRSDAVIDFGRDCCV
jgi:hypothetical protein